jgi:hypothetical protein
MWGHDPGVYDGPKGVYNIPLSAPMSMAEGIKSIDANFRKYRSLVPEKPTLLGIYMWDFGGKKELSKELMAQQLDYAYRLYKEGQIEGLIFHCTPLCNKGLAAVDYARQWIAKHGEEGRRPA